MRRNETDMLSQIKAQRKQMADQMLAQLPPQDHAPLVVPAQHPQQGTQPVVGGFLGPDFPSRGRHQHPTLVFKLLFHPTQPMGSQVQNLGHKEN